MYQSLIQPLDAFSQDVLKKFPNILEKVVHLSQAHKEKLPQAIFELSEILTSKRNYIHQSYWKFPKFVSAYMWYFLPWNLIRLTRLFSGLPLPKALSFSTLIDLGSGPLTLPLALWLSQPQWRECELRFLCVDSSPHIMKLGLEVFKNIALQVGEPLKWKFRFVHGPLITTLRSLPSAEIIMAGNVLNELKSQYRSEEYFRKIIRLMRHSLSPKGLAFFIEPGTRLGGILTSTLRDVALDENFTPLAPCTHREPCPLSKNTKRGWCHISFEAKAPAWLVSLTHLAKLQKNTLSLSFQLLQNNACMMKNPSGLITGRVVSQSFHIPQVGYARYVCTAHGLGVIKDIKDITFGSAITCSYSTFRRKDKCSGAVWLEVVK